MLADVIIIVRIEHKTLAVDDLAVLRDRNVNAGAALGVGQMACGIMSGYFPP